MNTGGSLVIASLYHAAQSFFVIINDGIGASQQSGLLAICNLALVLILALVSGPALRRGPSEHPAAMGEIQPDGPEPKAVERAG